VPHGNVNVTTNALGHLAPVHVSTCLLYYPDNLAQRGGAPCEVGEWNRARLRYQTVGSRALEKLGKGLVGLVEGDQDGGECVEGAGKQGRQKLDAVRQIDGDAFGAMLLQVLPNDGNLLGHGSNVVLRHALSAIHGHDLGRAAGRCAFLQRDFARDTAPDVAEVAVSAGRVHGSARRLHGQPGPQRVCRWLAHRTWHGMVGGDSYSHGASREI
jgi:hypothetical protein